MPIKLKYGEMKNDYLKKALVKLSNHAFVGNAVLSYRISKIIRKWDEECTIAQELLQKVVKAYAKKDGAGMVVPAETGRVPFEIEDGKREEFNKAIAEFEDHEFLIPVNPIDLDQLSNVGLSPNEIIALDAFLLKKEEEQEPAETAAAQI